MKKEDAGFCAWLRDRKIGVEWMSNNGNKEQLRDQYDNYLLNYTNESFLNNFEFNFFLNTNQEKEVNENHERLNLNFNNNFSSWLEKINTSPQNLEIDEENNSNFSDLNAKSYQFRKIALPKTRKDIKNNRSRKKHVNAQEYLKQHYPQEKR
ncbi:hypothetical protein C1645_744741 [Glomus cerebriforme]|uniref:Uncharacterized protein n=1 Tax=Glomus cerebriforme TaxID=658196 RepID=A0A397SEF5_9GLOM|nr:hypothetical protein C1645_744741 [Glomus cerebriforme]